MQNFLLDNAEALFKLALLDLKLSILVLNKVIKLVQLLLNARQRRLRDLLQLVLDVRVEILELLDFLVNFVALSSRALNEALSV